VAVPVSAEPEPEVLTPPEAEPPEEVPAEPDPLADDPEPVAVAEAEATDVVEAERQASKQAWYAALSVAVPFPTGQALVQEMIGFGIAVGITRQAFRQELLSPDGQAAKQDD